MLLNTPTPKDLENNHRISSLGTENATGKGKGKSGKTVIGKTGIELRYYKRDEYNWLSNAQKSELHEWRKSDKGKGKRNVDSSGGDGITDDKARISALESQLEQLIKLNKDMSEKIAAVNTTNTNDTTTKRNLLTIPFNQRSDS